MLNELDFLCKKLDMPISNIDGKYYTLTMHKEYSDAIMSMALELGLEASVEKVPFSLTVSYYKICLS